MQNVKTFSHVMAKTEEQRAYAFDDKVKDQLSQDAEALALLKKRKS